MITITAKTAGFRRGGIAHPAEATEHPDDAFTPEQLAALQTEPMLVVVVSPDAESGDKPKKTKEKAKEGGSAPPPAPDAESGTKEQQ